MKSLFSVYSWRFPTYLVYMLQSCEYQAKPYFDWLWRTKDFSSVMHRRQLDLTRYAKMLLLSLRLGMLIEIIIGIVLIVLNFALSLPGLWAFGLAIIIAYPLVWSILIIIPLELGRLYIVEPKAKRQINQASQIYESHKAIKIAVAGSYGKTSMKEVLQTVLSEGKEVTSTLANYNVAIEHAKLALRLNGKEEVLIIEYGEGAPGDVANFANVTHPTHAVITGLAPAHLNNYKTVDAAGKDIFSLASYLNNKNVYVNGESELAIKFFDPGFIEYSINGAGDWRVKNIKLSIDLTSFELVKGQQSLKLTSQLLGAHQVGVLSLAAILAMDLGLSNEQIEAGIAKTKPFDHRMQPYRLSGAWIIDDTYNGNIDGIKAGTALLSELPAKRKIYISPGLVEQGKETNKVHQKMGQLIANAKPDLVVLMDNSVTNFIKDGLVKAGFKGELRIEGDPLAFYQGLDHFVANGDLVLMQNDWTDNYA
jgi:UDP-N-acetylmuramoyl-tripeptide--D-alanyl-D-alanine ligase